MLLTSLSGPADQHAVGSRSCAGADAEEGIEGSVPCPAPIEAEHELVEVVLEVRPPQSVVDTKAPALEVGEQAMGPRQDNVRRHRTDRDRLMPDTGDVL